MKSILSYLKNNKHLFLLLYAVIYIPWFIYLEKTVTTNFHVIHMGIDDYIPFCEFFVIPYYAWFVYMFAGIGFIAFTNGTECKKMGLFLITGMTIFLIISTVYPNGHYLRPDTFPRNNLFTDIVKRLYESDTATNLFPSIHVYNSLGVHLALLHSKLLKDKRWIKIVSFFIILSIMLSTLFLKQHSMFDVLFALGLGVVMYSFAYGHLGELIGRKLKKNSPQEQII